VKKLAQLREKIAFALLMVYLAPMAYADQQLQLNNIGGTSGAGSADLNTWFTKITGYFQSGVNLLLIAFAAGGIWLTGTSIHKIYAANKDQRESPKTAIIGIIVGPLMTMVAIVVGVLRNSATPT